MNIMKGHRGDCSIYAYTKEVCDCGYLRQVVRSGTATEREMAQWDRHTLVLEITLLDEKLKTDEMKRDLKLKRMALKESWGREE